MKEEKRKFLYVLQLEYLTQKLRSMIYRDTAYAKVAEDIAEKKATKVMEVSARMGVPNIFTDRLYGENFIRNEFWQAYGLPRFMYKDDSQRKIQGNYDKWYLLYRGTVVRYNRQEARVVSNNPAKDSLRIRVGSETYDVNYTDVTIINNYKLI